MYDGLETIRPFPVPAYIDPNFMCACFAEEKLTDEEEWILNTFYSGNKDYGRRKILKDRKGEYYDYKMWLREQCNEYEL